MKKPKLEEYSDKVLVLLASQSNDDEYNDSILAVLTNRYVESDLSYLELHERFGHSKGIERKALSEALASRMERSIFFVNEDLLEDILPNISIERLWSLCKSNHLMVREKSREYLFEVMNIIEEEQKSKENKIKQIVYFRRKDERKC